MFARGWRVLAGIVLLLAVAGAASAQRGFGQRFRLP